MSQAEQPPPPPDRALMGPSPDVQRRMDDAVARLEALERRISAWEARMAALEGGLADAPGPATEDPRVGELDQRLARLEKRWFERRLAAARTPEPLAAAPDPAPRTVEPDEPAPRALVYAAWSTLDAAPGDTVEVSVLTDGFEPDEEVVFTIGDLGRPGQPVAIIKRAIGSDGGWVKAEWTPPALPKGRDTQMFSMVARCGDREAHAPILTARK